MVLLEGTLDIGVAFLLAVALAYYAKFKAERGFAFLGVSGVFFLFSAAFMDKYFAAGGLLAQIGVLQTLFDVLGWVFALIAAVFVAYETLLEK
jgi:hypothetical protein